jgi:hypothetical protein
VGTCITSITDATGCLGFVVNSSVVTGAIPSTGETVCEGGAPATIVGIIPYGGGDGQLSYSWWKDGGLIPGATGANYTPPATLTYGVHTYTRRVNDQTCNLTPLASEGSRVLTVILDPTVTVIAEESLCSGATPAAMTATATASCGTGTVSYQWYSGASSAAATEIISGATVSTYAPSSLTTTTYYSVVASFTGPGAWTSSGGCPSGWRLPTIAELGCLYVNSAGLPGSMWAAYRMYWSSTDAGNEIAEGRAVAAWKSCYTSVFGCTSSWARCPGWNIPVGNCYDVPKTETSNFYVCCVR